MTTVCPLPCGAEASFAVAVDPERVRGWIAEHLLADRHLLACEPLSLRYKGGDGATVCWSVRFDGDGGVCDTFVTVRWADPLRLAREAQRLGRRASDVTPGVRGWALLDEVLLVAFPIDRILRDLRRVCRPSSARTMIAKHFPDVVAPGYRISKRRSRMVVARYEPERRALLRWRLVTVDAALQRGPGAEVAVRLQGAPIARQAAAAGDAARATGIDTPRVVVVHDRLALESVLAGHPVADAPAWAERAGHQLARLHAAAPPMALRRHGALAELDRVLRVVGDFRRLDSGLAGRAATIADRLSRWVPTTGDDAVLSHGCFDVDHWLDVAGNLAIEGFDRAALAHPAWDLAMAWAGSRARDPSVAEAVADALSEGYRGASTAAMPAARVLGWYRACAAMRLALRPFQELRPDWPERAASMLDSAAAQLEVS